MKYILFIFALLLPASAFAQISITEIAWMGTTNSQYSEWIELYNDTSTTVNLAGWKLYESGGSVLIFTFTKSIPANGYLLLERITASAPDAVPGVDDESGPFGGGGLANTGEFLVIKDSSGLVIDSLNYSSGWPAGDATTKQTMQLSGSSWITAEPTPKAPTNSAGGGDDEQDDQEQEEIKDKDPIPKVSPNKPQIEFNIPKIMFPGVGYTIIAAPVLEYNYRIDKGNFYWNMGDGTVYRQEELKPITHIYQYEGDYTISFSYTDPNNHNPPLKGYKKIKVSNPTFSISVVNKKGLEIKNSSTTEIDLSGWKIITPSKEIIIPDMTIISPKSTVVVPFSILSIDVNSSLITINDPSGNIVASTQKSKHINELVTSNIDQPVELAAFSAQASDQVIDLNVKPSSSPIRNRTKTLIFSAVALFVIVLSILLERFMARQEY